MLTINSSDCDAAWLPKYNRGIISCTDTTLECQSILILCIKKIFSFIKYKIELLYKDKSNFNLKYVMLFELGEEYNIPIIFTPLEPSTSTVKGHISNIRFTEEELSAFLVVEYPIINIESNFIDKNEPVEEITTTKRRDAAKRKRKYHHVKCLEMGQISVRKLHLL